MARWWPPRSPLRGWGRCGIDWTTISPDNRIIVFDNVEEGGKYIAQWCQEIEKRNLQYARNVQRYLADPFEAFSSRSQGPSCADQALKAGIRFVAWPPDKGQDFDAGIDAIREALDASVANDPTKPRLYVCKRCAGVRSNFSSWAMKKDRTGEMKGADAYETGNDHSIDPLRGTIQSGILQRMRRQLIEEGDW